MSENNKKDSKKNKNKGKLTTFKVIKILLIILIVGGILAGGVLAGAVLSIVKDAPEIDPSNITASLAQTSSILDINGNIIEKI